jgi:hypothetical protein
MIDIEVGEVVKRSKLHDKYGGSRQEGISPAREANAIFLFADPEQAAQHGYVDGWGIDKRYHYCGQGTEGDQAMTRRNKALLNHEAAGRPVYLFEKEKTYVRLIGEFVVDSDFSFYMVDGLDKNNEPRQMIIFRLNQTSDSVAPPASPSAGPDLLPPAETVCDFIPIENHQVDQVSVNPSRAPHTAHRREGELVAEYSKYLSSQGHKTSRNRIVPAGERAELHTDLFDHTENVLVEAKGNVTRGSVRMAVGQLFDYSRHIKPRPRLATLFPVEPRSDLRDICASVNIATIWRSGNSFERSEPPRWNSPFSPDVTPNS